MTTYVLTISEFYPACHINAGLPTNFIDAVNSGTKKHTIRSNYPLWKKRFEKIRAGKAVLSLRVWTGKPYGKGSNQVEVRQYTSADGIGIEKVSFVNCRLDMPITDSSIINADTLAANDGLSPAAFVAWFMDQDLTEPKAIIHLTPFRYNFNI